MISSDMYSEPIYKQKYYEPTVRLPTIISVSLDDLVFDCGDSLVDISNLISDTRKRLLPVKETLKNLAPQPIRKRKQFDPLYPPKYEAEKLQELNVSALLEKCRIVHRINEHMSPGSHKKPAWGADQNTHSYVYYHSDSQSSSGHQSPPSSPFPTKSSSEESLQVEVTPGFFSPLRGSKETLAAISRGHSTNVSCFGCDTPLVCIADAEYVICPDCKVVSPTKRTMGDRKLPPKASFGLPEVPLMTGGVVGLGLRAEQL
jgi:hypothetical protein